MSLIYCSIHGENETNGITRGPGSETVDRFWGTIELWNQAPEKEPWAEEISAHLMSVVSSASYCCESVHHVMRIVKLKQETNQHLTEIIKIDSERYEAAEDL